MRVLLVNDDGPPAPHSPHILGLYETLKQQNGWDVSVVLPSSQKSWGSMAFTLHPPCSVWYYYPIRGNHDGTHEWSSESWSATRRAVKEDELGEWILVDGSPTTCANIGLFSLNTLQPDGKKVEVDKKPAFDLVISGPNFGRNSGTAFSLCSGTIGAALAASLSGVRSIAISYAHFHQPNKMVREAESKRESAIQKDGSSTSSTSVLGQLPASAPLDVVTRAHSLSASLAKKLYQDWEPEVGAYSINVPLTWSLIDENAGDKVYWTRTWDSQFGPLFALDEDGKESLFKSHSGGDDDGTTYKPRAAPAPKLALKFAPDMAAMLQPAATDEKRIETDIWAILHGHISVARLSPSYTSVSPSRQTSSGANGPGSHFKL